MVKKAGHNLIRHLILDVGGVLILKENTFFKALGKEYGFKLKEAEALIEKLNALSDTKKISPREYAERFNEFAGTNLTMPQLEKRKFNIANFNWPLVKFCIKNRHKFKTSILSGNFSINVFYTNKHLHFNKWTYRRFFSFRYGTGKDNPDFFKMALNRLRAKPEQCVFIDDVPRYVETARKLGMLGIVFTNNENLFGKLKKLL